MLQYVPVRRDVLDRAKEKAIVASKVPAFAAFALLIVASGLAAEGQDAQSVTPQQIGRLIETVVPKADEASWKQVTWHTDLMEARTLLTSSVRHVTIQTA